MATMRATQLASAPSQLKPIASNHFGRPSRSVLLSALDPRKEEVMTAATSRRAALMGCATLLALPLMPEAAQAYGPSTLCVDAATEADDAACRRNTLAKDLDKQEDYGTASVRKFEPAPNVPVSVLNDEYTQATLTLSEQITAYCSMDVYDKQRIPLIKSLKSDGFTWVSKYARGGSARTQSARRMYIAVDSVVGHLASNGYAPLPAPKVKAVLKSLDEAKDFLAKGI